MVSQMPCDRWTHCLNLRLVADLLTQKGWKAELIPNEVWGKRLGCDKFYTNLLLLQTPLHLEVYFSAIVYLWLWCMIAKCWNAVALFVNSMDGTVQTSAWSVGMHYVDMFLQGFSDVVKLRCRCCRTYIHILFAVTAVCRRFVATLVNFCSLPLSLSLYLCLSSM